MLKYRGYRRTTVPRDAYGKYIPCNRGFYSPIGLPGRLYTRARERHETKLRAGQFYPQKRIFCCRSVIVLLFYLSNSRSLCTTITYKTRNCYYRCRIATCLPASRVSCRSKTLLPSKIADRVRCFPFDAGPPLTC